MLVACGDGFAFCGGGWLSVWQAVQAELSSSEGVVPCADEVYGHLGSWRWLVGGGLSSSRGDVAVLEAVGCLGEFVACEVARSGGVLVQQPRHETGHRGGVEVRCWASRCWR